MKNKKSMKKTILLSAITAIAFGSIAVTTSYALFTDSAETNVTVTAGKVDVSATVSDLKLSSLDVDRTTDNSFTNGGTAVINGSSITLDKVSPGDKVTFKLAVTNSSTISTKYRTKLIAEDDDGLFEALEFSIGGYTSQKVGAWALTDGVSEATSIGSYDECYVYLPDTVGDEYQGKSCTLSFTVEAVQGNATVKNDVQYYTLSEFNALTELDDELETAYVSIGKQSLAESDVVIGNDNLKDTTALVSNLTSDTLNGQKLTVDDLKVGTVLDSGVRITGVDEQNQYHTITQKHGAKIYVSGGVYGGKDVELVSTIDNVPVLRLLVPDACDVVFNNFTVDGYFRLYTNSSPANLNSITFNKSTFNGVFQQAARIYTKLLDFEECVFNNYINTANQNNSNPIWIQTPYNLDFVMNKCEVHSTRPIKVVEGTVTGDYTFTNNTFDMSSEYANSSNTEGRHKNEGIKFESASALGNVLVTGNTISETTYALIAFNTDGKDTDGNGTIDDYEKTGINLATGSTFKVYGNNVGNNKLMVGWDKPNDEFTPSFVDTTDPTA